MRSEVPVETVSDSDQLRACDPGTGGEPTASGVERTSEHASIAAGGNGYALLFELSPDAILFVRGEDGEIVNANPSAEALYGYGRRALCALRVKDLVAPAALRDHEERLAFVGSAKGLFESVHLRADGAQIPVEVQVLRYQLGGAPALLLQVRDRTERVRMLNELTASEARLRAVVDNLPFDIWLADREGRDVLQNSTAVKHWGDRVGRHLEESSFPEDTRELFIENRKRVLAGTVVKGEVTFGEGGERRFCYNILTPIRDDEDIGGYAGVNIDITELKLAEASLRESEERYRTLVEQSPDAIALSDGETVLFANTAAARLFGVEDSAKLIGLPLRQLIHQSSRDLSRDRLQAMQSSGAVATDDTLVVQRADGSVRYLEGIVKLVTYRGKPTYQGQFRDVTERRTAQQRLELQAAALNATINGILIADPEMRVVWCNAAMEALFGSPLARIEGRIVRELIKGRYSRVEPGQSVQERLASGKPWQGELGFERPDGATRTLDVTATPLRSEDGNLAHIILIAQDVTERKSLEERLLQAEKLESIGLLAGGVAHDFNNILAVILGFSEVLRDATADPQLAGPLDEISEAARRGAAVTRRLLAFARKEVVAPQPVDPASEIQGMRTMLTRLIEDEISLQVESEAGGWKVMVDPGQFDQIIINLVTNARDAIVRAGTITLGTSNLIADEEYVRKRPGLSQGEYVLFVCTDTGKGMSSEVLNHAFDPFFTTKPQGRGTGLGLSTVYGIVKEFHGYVEIASEEGRGTAVSILIPRFVGEERAADKRCLNEERVQTATILVVDDETQLLELLVLSLEAQGHTTYAAHGAGEALQICESRPNGIDLLITDVRMPLMDGQELSERMKAMQPRMRTLFMSGYAQNVLAKRTPGSRAEFLQKPFELKELFRKVQELLTEPGA